MEHHMGLYDKPFYSMKLGRKTVEVRLNDEKRRKLKIGDTIVFTKVPENNEVLTAEIIGLRHYRTFREMYDSIPAKEFDTVGDPIDEMVEQTYEIYSLQQEQKWGTLAITVKIIK